MKKLIMIVGLFGLAACGHEGMAIQKQYAADRDDCRGYAEATAGGMAPASGALPSGKEHIMLVSQFARCMNKRGWAVNKPPGDVAAEAKRRSESGSGGEPRRAKQPKVPPEGAIAWPYYR